jgi:hypothetical protein
VVGGGDLPAVGGDFDVLRIVIGEVKEDAVGDGAAAAGGDATGDWEAADLVGGGLGFEEIEDGVAGVGRRDGVVLGVDAVVKPIAESGGANGEDAPWRGRDAYVDLAIGGGEGGGFAGDVDEAGEEGWFHKVVSASN